MNQLRLAPDASQARRLLDQGIVKVERSAHRTSMPERAPHRQLRRAASQDHQRSIKLAGTSTESGTGGSATGLPRDR